MRTAPAPLPVLVVLLALLCTIGAPQRLHAHGNVVSEEDACVIKIGFYRAHFSVYQPLTHQHFAFCEDLPDATETIFVLQYLHESMREVPVDFRIIKDTLNLGRFARSEDVTRFDLDEDTVFYAPARRQSDAVLMVLHSFAEDGDYIGIVTARSPSQDKTYTAVFPFSVGGFPAYVRVLLLGLASSAAAVVGLWLYYRRRPKVVARGVTSFAAVAGLVLSLYPVPPALADAVPSAAGQLTASFESADGPIGINRIHSWIVHVAYADGTPVEHATIQVTGGMPEHDHGLPTAPRMTRYLGNGDYLIEGMKFHMNGHWKVVVDITTDALHDVVTFDLEL